MSSITNIRARAADLHTQIGQRMLNEVEVRKITLSQLLEEEDPSASGDELSAFERQLEVAGIVTRTNRKDGYYADRFSAFEKDEHTKVLQAEFLDRTYRAVGEGRYERQVGSDFSGVDTAVRPIFQAALQKQFAPAVPLDSLVAFTTTVDDDSYRALYVTSEPSDFARKRVGQGAPIPEARLEAGERAINLYKYGRALVVTYEALRRNPIDTVAMFVQMAAIQAEMDKVAEVLNTIVNGDGNPGTAAEVIDLTDIDGDATAGTLTLRGWIGFKLRFQQPYVMNTELVTEETLLNQLFLPIGESGMNVLGMMPTSAFGGFASLGGGLSSTVSVGMLQEAGANRIIGLDRNNAVQRVIERGSNINESMRWIRNQTQELTFSENEGYAVIQPDAVKILNINA